MGGSSEVPSARLTGAKPPRSERQATTLVELGSLSPPMRDALKSLDLNNDGKLNPAEIERAVTLLKAEQSRSRSLWLMLCAAAAFTFVVAASNLVTSMVADYTMRTLEVTEQQPPGFAQASQRRRGRALSEGVGGGGADGSGWDWTDMAKDSAATLVSKTGTTVSTAASHVAVDLTNDVDPRQLTFVKSATLHMSDGIDHLLGVTGYTFHNASDVDLYTNVGRTIHKVGSQLWLAPSTNFAADNETRARHLAACEWMCGSATSGKAYSEVSSVGTDDDDDDDDAAAAALDNDQDGSSSSRVGRSTTTAATAAATVTPKKEGSPLTHTSYHHFEDDMNRYRADFEAYLPSIVSGTSDYELFLPVSYHLNPRNYDNLRDAVSCGVTGRFKWYGKMPDYKYCGFFGRECYSDDAWCTQHCASDIQQAFGDEHGYGSDDNTGNRVSAYFTWYSKQHNQPIMSGFWSPAYLAPTGVPRTCDEHPTMCDATAVVSQYWADEEPSGYADKSTCEAAGYSWSSAYKSTPAHCAYNSMSTSCTTGRCFDRGHIVPSGAMGQLFGRSGESFTMCNIAAQTSVLNECKWMYIEQVVACVGRYHRALTLAGSLGPWTPSERFSQIPKPEYQWKLTFLPAGEHAGVERDTALMWVLTNDVKPEYELASYCGYKCLTQVEDNLGLRFPDRIRDAYFPPNSTAILTELLPPSAQANCQISKAPDGHTPTPTHNELASWGPWNVIYADADAAHQPLPTFACPSNN